MRRRALSFLKWGFILALSLPVSYAVLVGAFWTLLLLEVVLDKLLGFSLIGFLVDLGSNFIHVVVVKERYYECGNWVCDLVLWSVILTSYVISCFMVYSIMNLGAKGINKLRKEVLS